MAFSKLSIAGVLAALALASPAAATQIFATSYDTPNGDGQPIAAASTTGT